jgi:hypothetical protein
MKMHSMTQINIGSGSFLAQLTVIIRKTGKVLLDIAEYFKTTS